ncbi:MAG TPA: hypothetical protein VN721_17410 [Flavipsychrobacter sp.]|nr:hypothetical protein [Flavipsychrobacter sp.]
MKASFFLLFLSLILFSQQAFCIADSALSPYPYKPKELFVTPTYFIIKNNYGRELYTVSRKKDSSKWSIWNGNQLTEKILKAHFKEGNFDSFLTEHKKLLNEYPNHSVRFQKNIAAATDYDETIFLAITYDSDTTFFTTQTHYLSDKNWVGQLFTLFKVYDDTIFDIIPLQDSSDYYTRFAYEQVYKKHPEADTSQNKNLDLEMAYEINNIFSAKYEDKYWANLSNLFANKGKYYCPVMYASEEKKYNDFITECIINSNHKLVMHGNLLPLDKPEFFITNHLGNNLNGLTGTYPFFMFHISNVLYDLRDNTTIKLPLPLGKYDFSFDAMNQLKPKVGLYICDVIGDGNLIKVLYRMSYGPYRVMVYNIKNKRVIYDYDFFNKDDQKNSVSTATLVKFDGSHQLIKYDYAEQRFIKYPVP